MFPQRFFFCVSRRKLGMAGQKLGASALLCYIHHESSELSSYFSLTVANVGTCQAVLCRDALPLALSKVFSLEQSAEEMERVKTAKAIITEVDFTSHPQVNIEIMGKYKWIILHMVLSSATFDYCDHFL